MWQTDTKLESAAATYESNHKNSFKSSSHLSIITACYTSFLISPEIGCFEL